MKNSIRLARVVEVTMIEELYEFCQFDLYDIDAVDPLLATRSGATFGIGLVVIMG